MFFPYCLPQHNYLAQVTSNIWGTKFKIVGLAPFLPTNLGAGETTFCSLPAVPFGTQTTKNNFNLREPKVENELVDIKKVACVLPPNFDCSHCDLNKK